MDIISNFVVFEGGDGSGTSTQIARLEHFFGEKAPKGLVCSPTFEPTGGPIGKIIRSALKNELNLKPETLARLFAADRNEYLYAAGGIIERCGKGELVVCDRYILSSFVYQGIDCGDEIPRSLNASFPFPQTLLFFDVDPNITQQRLGSRSSLDIYENLTFQEKVRAKYLSLLDHFRENGVCVEIIDASQTVEKVSEEVWRVLAKMPIFS